MSLADVLSLPLALALSLSLYVLPSLILGPVSCYCPESEASFARLC